MIGRRIVKIGQIIKPHGVRGELSVACYVESPLLFNELQELLLGDEDSPRAYELLHWREHQNRVLVTLKGIADRNAAEDLRQAGVFVPKEKLPPLEDGEVYLDDLLGLAVQLPDGSELGRLVEIQTPGGQEIWVVETPDGREVLFPAREETVDLDMDASRAIIHPPPGLLELYLGKE